MATRLLYTLNRFGAARFVGRDYGLLIVYAYREIKNGIISKCVASSSSEVTLKDIEAFESLAADGLSCGEQGSGMRVNGKTRELTLFGLRDVIHAAGYPARTLAIEDPDKNPLYLNLR